MTPGLRAAIASEWLKLATLRSTWILAALGIVLSVAMTVGLGMIIGSTWDDWSAADKADFGPTLMPLTGLIFAGVLFTVLGVRVVTSEYSSGMILLTLTATPWRGRLLAAKVVVVTALSLAGGLLATFATYLAGQAVYAAYDLPHSSLGEPGVLRALILVSLTTPFFPVVGAGLAVIFRSTAGAVTATLGLIFAPVIVEPLLPEWWRQHVAEYLPGSLSDSLSISHLAEDLPQHEPVLAAAALAGWLALFLGAAYLLLSTRDA